MSVTIGVWMDIPFNVMNFVAYKGSNGIRITIITSMTADQKQWIQKTLPVEFGEDAEKVAVSFNEHYAKFIKDSKAYSFGDDPASLATKMPGVHEKVAHPVDGSMNDVFHIIINLNDKHQWSREKIAEWLETLDIDIRFKVVEEESDAELVSIPPSVGGNE